MHSALYTNSLHWVAMDTVLGFFVCFFCLVEYTQFQCSVSETDATSFSNSSFLKKVNADGHSQNWPIQCFLFELMATSHVTVSFLT